MKLTIWIPNYNWWINLKRAIKSCLNTKLSIKEYEILIIDNCSTDNSINIIENLQKTIKNITLIQNNKNYWRIWNWNRILELSNWDFLILLFSNDQISLQNNISELIEVMKNKKIAISKSNKINIWNKNNDIWINKIISLKQFLFSNFKFLSSIPFWPIQTFIFNKNIILKNNIVFNSLNEITADHEFWLDIYKHNKNIKILKTTSFNIIFDNLLLNRVHNKLSYFDMHSSEINLLFKKENNLIFFKENKYVIKKYLTRINYIWFLNKISLWKVFKNLKIDDKSRLKQFYFSISGLSKKDFLLLDFISFFDLFSLIWFIKFIKNKNNSI